MIGVFLYLVFSLNPNKFSRVSAMVALLPINMKISKRLQNSKTAQKVIYANVRFVADVSE